MQSLRNWVAPQGAWSASELTLPALDPSAEPTVQRWCAIAGGLALILSRVSGTERSARFACTDSLYVLLQRRLRQGKPVGASAELLGEVMHEIAEVGDPLTRACLKGAFQASTRPDAEAAETSLPRADARASQPATSVRAGLPSSRSGNPSAEARATSLMPEALQERSAALRRSLAAARGTSLAEAGPA